MRKPTNLEKLERWWATKYSLPWNHSLFQDQTYDELLIQWYEELFQNNPKEVYRNEDGELQFTGTGDELIDLWEEQAASGEDVDMWAAFSEKAKKEIMDRLAKAKARRMPTIGQ